MFLMVICTGCSIRRSLGLKLQKVDKGDEESHITSHLSTFCNFNLIHISFMLQKVYEGDIIFVNFLQLQNLWKGLFPDYTLLGVTYK